MTIDKWLSFGLTLFISIIAYVYKTGIDNLKNEIKELKTIQGKHEDANDSAHKELRLDIGIVEDKMNFSISKVNEKLIETSTIVLRCNKCKGD
jgi:hypothetical protein